MKELKRLEDISFNAEPNNSPQNTYILSLNIRSLFANFSNLLKDELMRAKVIALQETWCHEGQETDTIQLPGYKLHLVSQGRRKGVATFFQDGFDVTGEVNKKGYQICRVSCKNYDVVNVYRSSDANQSSFFKDLGTLARGSKPCFICGDFNIDILKNPKDWLLENISSCGFKQIVEDATHELGGLLDHIYIKRVPWKPQITLEFPFYSDHAVVKVSKPET